MKTIKVGDVVYFLYCQHLKKGTCVRINKKSITVEYEFRTWDGNNSSYKTDTKRVPFDRIANEHDKFSVVWEQDIGVEGRYYITDTECPQYNDYHTTWLQPYMYVTKRDNNYTKL